MNQTTPIGKIIAISDLNVTILATGQNAKNRDILVTELNGKEHLFEVLLFLLNLYLYNLEHKHL